MLKSKLRAFIAGVSNIVRSRRNRHPELILEGVLSVIKTVVNNSGEYVWGVDILYPKKTQGYEYQEILFNYHKFYQEQWKQVIYENRQMNLPMRKRDYNFTNTRFDSSPREFIEKYLEGAVFIALDKNKYQIHVADRNLDKVLHKQETTDWKYNFAQRKFKEYTLPVTLSPIAG